MLVFYLVLFYIICWLFSVTLTTDHSCLFIYFSKPFFFLFSSNQSSDVVAIVVVVGVIDIVACKSIQS